jgi:hypothetical protein
VPATAVQGVATKPLSGQLAGPVTIQATASLSGAPAATSNTLLFNVVHGTASQIALSAASGGDLASGTARTFTATIEDAAGNTVTDGPDSTVSVSFTQPAGAGSLSGTGSAPATGGVATKSLTGVLAGSVSVRASATVNAVVTNSNTLTFNVVAGPATKLAFTASPSNSTGGVAFGTQPVVTIQDANGNTVTGDTSSVTLAIGTNPGGGTLTCATNPNTASGGVATFTGCKIDKAGNGYTLTATDGSLTSATSSAFNIAVGPAAQLAFTQQPAGAAPGVAFATQPKVTVQDAGGNTVTGDTGSVTLAIGTNPGSGTLSCTTNPLNAVAGVATFAGCKINNAGHGYTLTASRTGLLQGVSATFNVSALSPTALTIVNGTGTVGKAEQNDVITVTWNQAIQLSSVCSSWSTSSQTVTGVSVVMAKGTGSNTNDLSFSGGTVGATACSGGIKIGGMVMSASSGKYEPGSSADTFANSTVTWNAASNLLVITLGAPGTQPPNTVATSTYVYTPNAAIAAAANPAVTATGSATTGNVQNF